MHAGINPAGRSCFRPDEHARVTAALQAGESLLIVSEIGMGKSQLAEFIRADLTSLGFPVALISAATPKLMLLQCANQLGASAFHAATRQPTMQELQDAISSTLKLSPSFLILDDAHRIPISIRTWLMSLIEDGEHLLLLATHPPRKDIFLRLPRIELRPLSRAHIREVLNEAAGELGIHLPSNRAAALLERCAGNPMLARRSVREEYLGLDETAPDHLQWIDGTPFLLAGILAFSVLRFLGRGLHQTDLYLLGAFLAVAAAIARLFVFSLPRPPARLGR